MFIRIKSLSPLILHLLLVALSGCKYQNENVEQSEGDYQNKSDRPVRLVVSEQGLVWDEQLLSFEQPLKEWIAILGDNYYQGGSDEAWELRALSRPQVFIYPELGIKIDLGLNYAPTPEKKDVLYDPYNSHIALISIQLNPLIKTNNVNIREHLRTHFYNTMYADYAIDYFGAIIDSNTPTTQIIQFGRNVRYGDKATLGVFDSGGAAFSLLSYKPPYKTQPEMLDVLIVTARQ